MHEYALGQQHHIQWIRCVRLFCHQVRYLVPDIFMYQKTSRSIQCAVVLYVWMSGIVTVLNFVSRRSVWSSFTEELAEHARQSPTEPVLFSGRFSHALPRCGLRFYIFGYCIWFIIRRVCGEQQHQISGEKKLSCLKCCRQSWREVWHAGITTEDKTGTGRANQEKQILTSRLLVGKPDYCTVPPLLVCVSVLLCVPSSAPWVKKNLWNSERASNESILGIFHREQNSFLSYCVVSFLPEITCHRCHQWCISCRIGDLFIAE